MDVAAIDVQQLPGGVPRAARQQEGHRVGDLLAGRHPPAQWDAALAEYEAMHPLARKPAEYPMGTVALYGPDDKTTTKIAAGVLLNANAEPIIQRWVSTNIMNNAKVQKEVQEFFTRHGVKAVAMSDGNMGCPHEEGLDFPELRAHSVQFHPEAGPGPHDAWPIIDEWVESLAPAS